MNPEVRKQYELANTYLSIGKFKESETLFKQIIVENQEFYEAYIQLAVLYSRFDRDEQAYQIALIARDIFGPDCLINQFIYFYYKDQNDYVKAEDILIESLEIEPQNSSMMIRYAELLIMAKSTERAKIQELVKQAIAYGYDNSTVLHYCVYFSLLKIDVLMDINDLIVKYIEGLTDEYTKYKALGLRSFHLKRYKDAYEFYYQAFSIRPSEKELVFRLTEIKVKRSFLFLLRRIIEKTGGVHTHYIVLLLLVILFECLNLEKPAGIVFFMAIMLILYWLLTFFIYIRKLKKAVKE